MMLLILKTPIGGAPLLYIIIAIVLVIFLGFIPASVVMTKSGAGWPLHDVIHPLIGLILGPIAGPIASISGFILSNAITPYTSLGTNSYLIGGMSAFTVGMVVQKGSRYWLVPWLVIAAAHLIFFIETRGYGVSPLLWFSNVFTVTIALTLIAIPPVRHWVWKTVSVERVHWKTGVAYYILFLIGSTGGIQLFWSVTWLTDQWESEFWLELVPIIFLERTIFTLIGVLIAIGIVPLLRQSSWSKPTWAGY